MDIYTTIYYSTYDDVLSCGKATGQYLYCTAAFVPPHGRFDYKNIIQFNAFTSKTVIVSGNVFLPRDFDSQIQ